MAPRPSLKRIPVAVRTLPQPSLQTSWFLRCAQHRSFKPATPTPPSSLCGECRLGHSSVSPARCRSLILFRQMGFRSLLYIMMMPKSFQHGILRSRVSEKFDATIVCHGSHRTMTTGWPALGQATARFRGLSLSGRSELTPRFARHLPKTRSKGKRSGSKRPSGSIT
ncbi:hypothetical protein GALMADRAFT_440924 [Galerina marginata CBS 339.88]|uniref:Uncharacterized protein n=1 Tax=Galerina marginata (strain CBS 339.88) TaxID=685588 RepID=A0A067T2D9_GALM3|nr:hypothetical protein GALMADRAFT_440924 [Galerina marginata CBS 339.88]